MPEVSEQEYSHQRLQQVNTALDSGMFVYVRKLLQDMPAYDLALLLESSPSKSRMALWQLIDADHHGDVLEELNEEVRKSILKNINPEKLAAVAEGMDVDDLAEVFRTLPDSVYQEVLNAMDWQDRSRVETALSFEEDTAGGIMNTDTISIRPDVTVDVVLRYLRLRGKLPEATDSFYVVDREDHFIGAVSLSSIVTAKAETIISHLIDKDIQAITADLNEKDVAQLFERYDWFSAPVIDHEGRLLGRITVDDVVDIIREEAEHSMMSMAGLDDDEDTFAPVLQSTKRRSVWLAVNLVTALMAAMVSDLFEATLSQLAVLAILNTIVPSMGGVAGNQTLTLVIRGMALGHVNANNSRWLISKEISIGFLNGAIWAILIASVIALWKQDYMLGIIIAFAMLVNMIAAAMAGATLPLIMKRLKIDPALAGSVILTTITDVVGIFAFLGTATLFLM